MKSIGLISGECLLLSLCRPRRRLLLPSANCSLRDEVKVSIDHVFTCEGKSVAKKQRGRTDGERDERREESVHQFPLFCFFVGWKREKTIVVRSGNHYSICSEIDQLRKNKCFSFFIVEGETTVNVDQWTKERRKETRKVHIRLSLLVNCLHLPRLRLF